MRVKLINNDKLSAYSIGEEFDVKYNPNNSSYYAIPRKSGSGNAMLYQSRFEIISKDPEEFVVGDLIRGLGNHYGQTNQYSVCKIVEILSEKKEDGSDIKVEIISHEVTPHNIGNIFHVKKNQFKLESSHQEIVQENLNLTDQEILDSIEITFHEDYGFITKIKDSTGKIFSTGGYGLAISASGFSCGIKRVSNLNSLRDNLTNLFKKINKVELLTNELLIDLLKRGFKILFETYSKAGLMIMSTNYTDNINLFKIIATVLESFEHVTYEDTFNPNSNHMIRMWTVNLSKIQNCKKISEIV